MKENGRPIIGITMDFELRERPSGKKETSFIYRSYYEALREAGALPLLIPPTPAKDMIHFQGVLDGIVLTGGDDLDPALYGEYPVEGLEIVHPLRQALELDLARFATENKIPLLGICLGLQVINVSREGSLIQDIPTQLSNPIPHRSVGKIIFHEVEIVQGTRLDKILGERKKMVNTFHHQGIRSLGKGLVANAQTSDGLKEGIEDPSHPFLMAFQWHLELNRGDQPFNLSILKAFVQAAQQHKEEYRSKDLLPAKERL